MTAAPLAAHGQDEDGGDDEDSSTTSAADQEGTADARAARSQALRQRMRQMSKGASAPPQEAQPSPSTSEAATTRRVQADRERLQNALSRFLRGRRQSRDGGAANSFNSSRSVFEVTLPLLIDGRYAGDVLARLSTSGDASIQADRLAQLLDGIGSPALVERVQAAGDEIAFLPLSFLGELGFPLTLDASTLELSGRLPNDDRAVHSIGLGPQTDRAPRGTVIRPEPFAFGLSVAASQRYVHESEGNAPGRLPVSARVSGAANVGGIHGVNVVGQAFYDEGNEEPWERGDVALFKDFPDRALRVTAGDVSPLTTGFQTAPGFGGLAIQRLFSEIQPLRNVRPSGRRRFTLDRPSTVEIFVNGVPTQTLRLEPGPFEITDIPFSNGLNAVVIVVEDETGVRQEIAAFSQFFDFSLLDRGVAEFEFVVGQPSLETGSRDYDDNVAATGFYRIGVTNALTLAAHGQVSDGYGLAGTEATVATPIGVFFAEVSSSSDSEEGEGYAGAFGWNVRGGASRGQREFSLLAEKRDETFVTLEEALTPALDEDATTDLDREYEVRARFRTPLVWDIQGSVSGAYAPALSDTEDDRRASLNLSRSFGRVAMSLSYDWADTFDRDNEHSVLVSLNLRAGRRQSYRAQYDSLNDRQLIEWNRRAEPSVGSFELNAGVVSNDVDAGVFGGVEYTGNRFDARLEHERIEAVDGLNVGAVEQSTTLDFETGFGFAGGRFAVGPGADQGFAIISRHPTLGRRPIAVGTEFVDSVLGRAGLFGPALAPTRTPYQSTVLQFDVRDLPLGYDIGDAAIELRPGAYSGYAFQVGSDASNTVMGTLKTRSGRPLPLRGGRLRSRDDPDAEPVPFFTNRTGRFVAEGVAPGRYLMYLVDTEEPIATITVAPTEPGIVNMGDVIARVEG